MSYHPSSCLPVMPSKQPGNPKLAPRKAEAQVEKPVDLPIPTDDRAGDLPARAITRPTPAGRASGAGCCLSKCCRPSVQSTLTPWDIWGFIRLRDMLYYFPRRYDDYSQLKPINRLWYGEVVTVIGSVQSVNDPPGAQRAGAGGRGAGKRRDRRFARHLVQPAVGCKTPAQWNAGCAFRKDRPIPG